METNKQKTSGNFYEKILAARMEMPKPARNGINKFNKYKYVTLEDLFDAVLPSLMKHGLLCMTRKEYKEGVCFLTTYIMDVKTHENIANSSILNLNLEIQKEGGEITYKTRYNLSSMLCIRVDFDDDGEEIKTATPKENVIDEKKQIEIHELMKCFTEEEQRKNKGFCFHKFNKKIDELATIEQNEMIRFLKNKKNKLERDNG